MAENIMGKEFAEKVIEKSKQVPVLVDFWAAWCGPCRVQAPILEEVSKEMGEKASIVKLDVDAFPEIAGSYSIRSIPTLLLFRDGRVVDTKIGVQSKEALVNNLEDQI